MKKKVCAVCGDTCQMNVRLTWKRNSDGNCYSICCACAEADKVNAKSVENFKSGYLGKDIDKNTTKRKKIAFTKGYSMDYRKRGL